MVRGHGWLSWSWNGSGGRDRFGRGGWFWGRLNGAFGDLFFEDGFDLGDGGLEGIASCRFNLSDPVHLNGFGGGEIKLLTGQLLVLHLYGNRAQEGSGKPGLAWGLRTVSKGALFDRFHGGKVELAGFDGGVEMFCDLEGALAAFRQPFGHDAGCNSGKGMRDSCGLPGLLPERGLGQEFEDLGVGKGREPFIERVPGLRQRDPSVRYRVSVFYDEHV